MEFACRSRPTTVAADDDESSRLRRFPDPPPPLPRGDANASPVDAALSRRREELLSELHKGHIRQDMIWRELIETERVMGYNAASQNSVQTLPWFQEYWHCRSFSMPPWEEAPLRPLFGGAEHPPCSCRSSTGVRAPPVYPHVERSPLLQQRPASDTEKQQDCRSSEQRMHPTSGLLELFHTTSNPNPAKETSGHQWVDVREKGDMDDGHGMQPLHEINNQNSGKWKAIESGIDDLINKPMQQRFKQADQENAACNEQKRTEFSEPAPEITSSGVKRKLVQASSPDKKQKPLGCDLYQVNPVSQHHLDEHLAGKWHHSNVAAPQTFKSNTPEPSPKATPVWSRITAMNTRSFHQDAKENVAENRWRCNLCQAYCNNVSNYHDHLGGRRHRENTEAMSVELKEDANTEKRAVLKSALYCMVCDVQCTSLKMLESHLGGRKHRERLEGSDSD